MRSNIVPACVFGAVLATALVGTWRGGTPRFEGTDAHAAQRVEARSTRVEAPVQEVPRCSSRRRRRPRLPAP